METLFGAGYELHKMKELVQPGEFAAEEKVSLVGPRGRIDNVRVLGPLRDKTQIEISMTDALKLGIDPELRLSGDLAGSSGIRLEAGSNTLGLSSGLIIARRHLHLSEEEVKVFGLSNGDVVYLKKTGPRETLFGQFIVRCGPAHRMEAHLDTDEANAAMIKGGDLLQLLPELQPVRKCACEHTPEQKRPVTEGNSAHEILSNMTEIVPNEIQDENQREKKNSHKDGLLDFVTEKAVKDAYLRGETTIKKAPGAIVTPAAKDAARGYNIKIY
jgi:putative phosphotransacetylase